MSLTVVTVTNNDEPSLAGFMDQLVCDQWVVVDQGSTDRTLELVQSWPGAVDLVAAKFTDHRDGARPEAMDRVTSDWVLFLSPDEVIEKSYQPIIAELMQTQLMRGWYFPIRHRVYFRDRIVTEATDAPQLRLAVKSCLTVPGTYNHGVSIRGFGGGADVPILRTRTIQAVVADLERTAELQPSEYVTRSLEQARQVLHAELAREVPRALEAAAV